MSYGLVLIPFLSALIGWLAVWLPAKMLFHPEEPKHVLWLTLQGYFPKQQAAIAKELAKLVTEELFSLEKIGEKISHPDNFQKLVPLAEKQVDSFLRIKLPQQMPVIGMLVGERTIREMKTVFMGELESLFPIIMKAYVDGIAQDLDIENLVAEKLAAVPVHRLEPVFNRFAGPGLKKAAILAAAMGFLIGILQVFIATLL